MAKYKVRDRVRIRSWESMERKFRARNDEDIESDREFFLRELEKYCGETQIISKSYSDGTYSLKGINWTLTEEMLEEEKEQSIHITKIGNGVHAVLKENGNVIKHSKATWDKEGNFNFEYGSKLAVDRLFDDEKEEDGFKPYLAYYNNDEFISEIGIKTNMTLAFGEELYVGDVVEVYDISDNRTVKNEFVCGNDFVMGLRYFKFKNGIDSKGKYQIRKVQSYKDLKHYQIVDDVIVKLKEY